MKSLLFQHVKTCFCQAHNLKVAGSNPAPATNHFGSVSGAPRSSTSSLSRASRACQSLGLQRTQVVDLEPLKGLTSLQLLGLEGTQVVDLEPLQGLTSLQRLRLWRTQVVDLEPLKGLTSLQLLGLEGTQVSDDAVARLRAALPDLKIFR